MLNFAELRHRTKDFQDDYYKLTAKAMSHDGRLLATGINDSLYQPTFRDPYEMQDYYESIQHAELRTHIKIWDIWDRKVIKCIRDEDVSLLTFSFNNQYLASSYYKEVTIRDTKNWEIKKKLSFNEKVLHMLFSPDNQYFIAATSTYSQGVFHIFDTKDFQLIKTVDVQIDEKLLEPIYPNVTISENDQLLFNHDGKYFIFGHSWDSFGFIQIYDTTSWKAVHTIGNQYINHIEASSNANLLGIIKNSRVSILDLDSMEEKSVPVINNEEFETESLSPMVFSPDNKFLFVNGGYIEETRTDSNSRVIFPDFKKRECLAVLCTETMTLVKSFENVNIKWMAFNSDGDLMVVYENNVKVIDIEDWSEVFRVENVGYFGTDLEFDPKRDVLTMNKDEKYVLLLRMTKSSLEKYIRAKKEQVKNLAFEDYDEDEIGEYDYNEDGRPEIGGGYNRDGYNRSGKDKFGYDELGYFDDDDLPF